MSMELITRTFRLERGSSLKLGKSNSSLLLSESISSECARIASYKKLFLSRSVKLGSEHDVEYRSRKSRALGFISKVFNFRNMSSHFETAHQGRMEIQDKKKKKKKRSSWLPDPERRWPVQGW